MGLKINGGKAKGDGTFDAPTKGTDYSEHLGTPKVGKSGTATVNVKKVDNKSKAEQVLVDTSEKIGGNALIPADQMATIHVTGAQTVGLPNYSSIKFQIGLTLPSHINDIDETYEFASDWVSARMAEAVKSVQ